MRRESTTVMDFCNCLALAFQRDGRLDCATAEVAHCSQGFAEVRLHERTCLISFSAAVRCRKSRLRFSSLSADNSQSTCELSCAGRVRGALSAFMRSFCKALLPSADLRTAADLTQASSRSSTRRGLRALQQQIESRHRSSYDKTPASNWDSHHIARWRPNLRNTDHHRCTAWAKSRYCSLQDKRPA